MEAGLANLVEPGDTVIVGVSGYFGGRIVELARRAGADVVTVAPTGDGMCPNARLLSALEEHPYARLLAVVHGETSTGSQHPLAELGAQMRERTLLMADCVTTLGGVEFDFDGWGIDYAYSCTQKCLAAPPGMSPIAVRTAPSSAGGGDILGPLLDRLRAALGTGSSARRPITTRPRSSTSMRSTRCFAKRWPRGSSSAGRGTRSPGVTSSNASSRPASSSWPSPTISWRR